MGFVPVTLLSALGKRKRGGRRFFPRFFLGMMNSFRPLPPPRLASPEFITACPSSSSSPALKRVGRKLALPPHIPHMQKCAPRQCKVPSKLGMKRVSSEFISFLTEGEGGRLLCVCRLEIRSAQGTM